MCAKAFHTVGEGITVRVDLQKAIFTAIRYQSAFHGLTLLLLQDEIFTTEKNVPFPSILSFPVKEMNPEGGFKERVVA